MVAISESDVEEHAERLAEILKNELRVFGYHYDIEDLGELAIEFLQSREISSQYIFGRTLLNNYVLSKALFLFLQEWHDFLEEAGIPCDFDPDEYEPDLFDMVSEASEFNEVCHALGLLENIDMFAGFITEMLLDENVTQFNKRMLLDIIKDKENKALFEDCLRILSNGDDQLLAVRAESILESFARNYYPGDRLSPIGCPVRGRRRHGGRTRP